MTIGHECKVILSCILVNAHLLTLGLPCMILYKAGNHATTSALMRRSWCIPYSITAAQLEQGLTSALGRCILYNSTLSPAPDCRIAANCAAQRSPPSCFLPQTHAQTCSCSFTVSANFPAIISAKQKARLEQLAIQRKPHPQVSFLASLV